MDRPGTLALAEIKLQQVKACIERLERGIALQMARGETLQATHQLLATLRRTQRLMQELRDHLASIEAEPPHYLH